MKSCPKQEEEAIEAGRRKVGEEYGEVVLILIQKMIQKFI